MKKIDVLCVGETLIDFIGHQLYASIEETKDYHRYLGGSPTNVAMNLARLGMCPRLVSVIGDDGFGKYVKEKLVENSVDITSLKEVTSHPTSVIFVSKTTSTPDFIPFREADKLISESQLPDKLLKQSKIFHTTCFALSKNPAQTTILNAAKRAVDFGCKLSIDLNYAPLIWPDRENAMEVIQTYCSYNPLVKISEDDVFRIFDKELSHEAIFDIFHGYGVDKVCLTLGSAGVKLSQKDKGVICLPSKKITVVKDATGAGDAFWSGYLFSYIKNYSEEESLDTALSLAAIKLKNVGRLPQSINIHSELNSI